MSEELRKEIATIISWWFLGYISDTKVAELIAEKEGIVDKLLAPVEGECDKVALESAKKAKRGMWGAQR